MQINEFKRVSALVHPVKEVKSHLRLLPRKSSTALLVHGVIGLSSAVGLLVKNLTPYITGTQLNDELRSRAAVDLGDVYQNLAVLARVLKVKLPSAGKKIKLKGETTTQGLMALHAMAINLLDQVRAGTDGGLLGEDLNLTEHAASLVKAEVEAFVPKLYAFTYTLLGDSPEALLQDHHDHLHTIYGIERFAKKAKPVKPESAAAE